jgi:hypothetical protein
VTTKEWVRVAKVPDVEARAKRWEELRNRPGDWIRILDGDEIVELPISGLDADLLAACTGGEWTPSLTIVGRVLANNPTSDSLLVWRIRELLRVGTLEARGEETSFGYGVLAHRNPTS